MVAALANARELHEGGVVADAVHRGAGAVGAAVVPAARRVERRVDGLQRARILGDVDPARVGDGLRAAGVEGEDQAVVRGGAVGLRAAAGAGATTPAALELRPGALDVELDGGGARLVQACLVEAAALAQQRVGVRGKAERGAGSGGVLTRRRTV